MIKLKPNNLFKDEICSLSGEVFTPDLLAFFAEDGSLVRPEEALKRGFTMEPVLYNELSELYSNHCTKGLESSDNQLDW
jgi:hypothetical protein